MRNRFIWKLSKCFLPLGERTAVMGILNVTPDSFSDGGKYFDLERATARGREIEQEGADIIDIGGESSRPGSEAVPEDEEMRRVLPVIEGLAGSVRIPISVDTYRASVARRAIEAGAQIVNDISGLRFDGEMPRVICETEAGAVLMHSRGDRDRLHKQTRMEDPIREVMEDLTGSAQKARAAGVQADAMVLDPGIGFGKAADESVAVLKNLSVFSRLGYPILVGTSRKSFIRTIAPDSLEARNWGTAATIVAAIMNGAHIVRVHDVRQSRVLADVTDKLV